MEIYRHHSLRPAALTSTHMIKSEAMWSKMMQGFSIRPCAEAQWRPLSTSIDMVSIGPGSELQRQLEAFERPPSKCDLFEVAPARSGESPIVPPDGRFHALRVAPKQSGGRNLPSISASRQQDLEPSAFRVSCGGFWRHSDAFSGRIHIRNRLDYGPLIWALSVE